VAEGGSGASKTARSRHSSYDILIEGALLSTAEVAEVLHWSQCDENMWRSLSTGGTSTGALTVAGRGDAARVEKEGR
jgi:hypothetical protein